MLGQQFARAPGGRRGQSTTEYVLIIALVVVILFLGMFMMRRTLLKIVVKVGEAVGLWSKEEDPSPDGTPGQKGALSPRGGTGTPDVLGSKSPGPGGDKAGGGGAPPQGGGTGPVIAGAPEGSKQALEIDKEATGPGGKPKKKPGEELEIERRERDTSPMRSRGDGGRGSGDDGGGLFGLSMGKTIFVLGAGLGVLVGAGLFLRLLRRR